MDDVPLFTLNEGEAVLCRIPDFAKAHNIPVQTLYSAVSSGRILHVRSSGKLYMHARSAEDFTAAYRKLHPLPEGES